ncbi:MAG: hypothetical protein J1G06_09830, partial [Oscillospiraceae bacterium]|nr:hypothetical protein [Oscillospiraceae bacterium]
TPTTEPTTTDAPAKDKYTVTIADAAKDFVKIVTAAVAEPTDAPATEEPSDTEAPATEEPTDTEAPATEAPTATPDTTETDEPTEAPTATPEETEAPNAEPITITFGDDTSTVLTALQEVKLHDYLTYTARNSTSTSSQSGYSGGATIDDIKFPNRIKTGGKSDFATNSAVFTFTPPCAGELKVYFTHGSSSGADRSLVIKQNDVETSYPVAYSTKTSATQTITADTVYIGCDNNIGIYGIIFTPAEAASISTLALPEPGEGEVLLDATTAKFEEGATVKLAIDEEALGDDKEIVLDSTEEVTLSETKDGYATFTMPAADVTIKVQEKTTDTPAPAPTDAPTTAPVVDLTFDGDDVTNVFTGVDRTTVSIADDPAPEADGDKALKMENASNAYNGGNAPKAYYNFVDAVDNATSVTVEFDSYMATPSAQELRLQFNLYDSSVRPAEQARRQFNNEGIVFSQGKNNQTTEVQRTATDKELPVDEWLHTTVTADYLTKQISYTIENAEGEVLVSAENAGYMSADANYITGIEIYAYQNYNVGYLDNIKVYAEIGEAAEVTINYVDATKQAEESGYLIKSETDDTAVKTLSYTVPAAKTANFDDKDEDPDVRYTYNAGKSSTTIDAVSEDNNTVTLAFDPVKYAETNFNVILDTAADDDVVIPVAVSGTPDDTTAVAVDTTVEVSISNGGTKGSASLKLLPGTYNYSISEVEGYKDVTETAVTVGEDNEISVEAVTAATAKLTVNYVTAPSQAPVVTKEYVSDVPLYVGDQVTLGAEYRASVKSYDEDSKLYTVYTYVSGGTEEITIDDPADTVEIIVKEDPQKYLQYEDYDALTEMTDDVWKSNDTSRYTVGLVSDESGKYVQVSSVGNGGNGTAIESGALNVEDGVNAIIEFDMALTQANGQTSSVFVATNTYAAASANNGWHATGYLFGLFQKTSNQTIWSVNDQGENTLEAGKYYHFKVERIDDGVKVTITTQDGGSVLEETTYTTSQDSNMTASGPLTKIIYNTARYWAGMKFDNLKVYKAN